MLKFLSKVKIDFNASDPRVGSCLEFLSQCNARKARDSNPSCQLLVNRRLDDRPPKIGLTFINGAEEEIDASETPSQTITDLIREKGRFLEAQKIFLEHGKPWPVLIPAEELQQPVVDGLKIIVQQEKIDKRAFTGAELRIRLTSFDRFEDPKVNSSSKDMKDTGTEAEEVSARKKKKAQDRRKAKKEEE